MATEVFVRRSEFSEDRRKTSRGICLSNLTEPTKPVVYTDRGGVAGRYPPTNYSLLFILFTRVRAPRSHIYARRERRVKESVGERKRERKGEIERGREKEKRERESDAAINQNSISTF